MILCDLMQWLSLCLKKNIFLNFCLLPFCSLNLSPFLFSFFVFVFLFRLVFKGFLLFLFTFIYCFSSFFLIITAILAWVLFLFPSLPQSAIFYSVYLSTYLSIDSALSICSPSFRDFFASLFSCLCIIFPSLFRFFFFFIPILISTLFLLYFTFLKFFLNLASEVRN